MKVLNPLHAIRKHCVECAGTANLVKWCSCHENNPCSNCTLWPYRFGVRPATAAKTHGNHVMDPDLMPPDSVLAEECEQWFKEKSDARLKGLSILRG